MWAGGTPSVAWIIRRRCGCNQRRRWGSNGPRVRLWKWELQKLADKVGIAITVCHLPPGTLPRGTTLSHRLFSFISQNWRSKPRLRYEVIIKLIAATTTKQGLTVQCHLDTDTYPSGLNISDEDMAVISIQRNDFHGEWNYTILPRRPST